MNNPNNFYRYFYRPAVRTSEDPTDIKQPGICVN